MAVLRQGRSGSSERVRKRKRERASLPAHSKARVLRGSSVYRRPVLGPGVLDKTERLF